MISDNQVGVCLYQSSGNFFYHNSFIGIDIPVISNFQSPSSSPSGSYQVNIWDNEYPSGGNYWSDYSGVDEKSGPRQNLTGSDGIADMVYAIDANNTDRYPLMAPFHTFALGTWNGTLNSVDIVSNSTITNVSFNQPAKTLSFNLTITSGTIGFCRVTVPKALMWCANLADWTVKLNNTQVPSQNLSITTDASYTYFYFSYYRSAGTVQTTSISAIPEFQPSMLLPLLIIMLLTVAVSKRKRTAKK
jgi:hypothetical protein